MPALFLLASLLLAPVDSLYPTSPIRKLALAFSNDIFFARDYYFTQGITMDWVSPVLARSPINYLLCRGAAGSTQSYGVALRYDMFTPLDIQDPSIRRDDRPYATYGYVSLYRTSNQAARRQRLTTALEIGYLGPAAGGGELQTTVHRLTSYARPRGWQYQIGSAAIIGYHSTFEKQLLTAGQSVELVGQVEASLGTLYTYSQAGLRLRIGHLSPYFTSPHLGNLVRRWHCATEVTLTERLVGYDATLQGGLFTHSSPDVLTAKALKRVVMQGSGSLLLTHGGMSFALTATVIAPEFTEGLWHPWGIVGVGQSF